MSRLLHLLRWDAVVQFRSGFWVAGFFATAPWAAVLYSLSQKQADFILPAMIFLDVSLIGTMFMAGVYFLEKNEGSLQALAVTPVRTWEWMLSKLISLTIIATVMSVALVLVKKGTSAPWGYALLAFVCVNVTFTLIGFIVAAPFSRFTNFIVVNSLFFAILNLPSLAFFDIHSSLYWLLPSQPALMMLRGAFTNMPLTEFAGYFAIQMVWIAAAFALCIHLFHRNVSQRLGG